MKITTKYEIGSVVYAVHSCGLVSGGQLVLNDEMYDIESDGAEQEQCHADIIYIVSPYEVKEVSVSCNRDSGTEVRYRLSDGSIWKEDDIFEKFEEAITYAKVMYSKTYERVETGKFTAGMYTLKELVCMKLQDSLKAVLSPEQLERFAEEFLKITEGMRFREAGAEAI